MINKSYLIINQFPSFQFVVRYLNVKYIIQCTKNISDNNLLSPNQSSFRTGDSCIKKILSITYDIFHGLDEGMETRAIFLDISKPFDKIWHKDLLISCGIMILLGIC